MSSTLSERIKERMAATGLNNAQLASAARVKPPTSFNWGSGKTKQIKGEPLLLAAKALGVTPEWLSTGKGPKLRDLKTDVPQPSVANDVAKEYVVVRSNVARARALLDRLSDAAVDEAILHLEWLEAKHKKTARNASQGDPIPRGQGR